MQYSGMKGSIPQFTLPEWTLTQLGMAHLGEMAENPSSSSCVSPMGRAGSKEGRARPAIPEAGTWLAVG
jgi:hypothetical protein